MGIKNINSILKKVKDYSKPFSLDSLTGTQVTVGVDMSMLLYQYHCIYRNSVQEQVYYLIKALSTKFYYIDCIYVFDPVEHPKGKEVKVKSGNPDDRVPDILVETIKEFMKLAGIKHVISPDNIDAETILAQLQRDHVIEYILSNDSDLLALGAYNIIKDFNKNSCVIIDSRVIHSSLNLTKESFIDLCILLGTDYNKNIKGIGPVASFNLINEYKCIENILENKKLKEIPFDYLAIRKKFTNDNEYTIIKNFVNKQELHKFLENNNVDEMLELKIMNLF